MTSAQRKKLKSVAQRLEATVRIGKQGLSPSLLESVDQALAARELVKVKFTEFKEEKKALAPLLAEKTSSELVTLVGNVAVLFRQNPDPEKRAIPV
ncbi:MAG: YhbY family RNA-binding protein [Verrucomicrobiota bacterium]